MLYDGDAAPQVAQGSDLGRHVYPQMRPIWMETFLPYSSLTMMILFDQFFVRSLNEVPASTIA